MLNKSLYSKSKLLCEKGISFEVRALVTLSESRYLGDSEKGYVVCQVVDLCHGMNHMN